MARSHGGRGGFEPRARILDRRARAWKLSMAGRTQREIADELGVSQPAVKKMLDRAAADQAFDLRRDTRVHFYDTSHNTVTSIGKCVRRGNGARARRRAAVIGVSMAMGRLVRTPVPALRSRPRHAKAIRASAHNCCRYSGNSGRSSLSSKAASGP
jgi:hypothetical protein